MLGAHKKALQQKAKGLEIDKLPLLVSFRTFCICNEAKKDFFALMLL